jgi:NB-ARC domain/HEAT repeats
VSAIVGLGGLGKSVLATALVLDEAVRSRFEDGILWVTLGQNPDLQSCLGNWIRELDKSRDGFSGTTLESASGYLNNLLAERRMLLVVDDVWDAAHVDWFRVGGVGCRVLVTTREARIEGADYYPLALMSEDASIDLVRRKLGRLWKAADEGAVRSFARVLGYLPLALDLAANQVRDGMSWRELRSEFEDEHRAVALEVLDTSDAWERLSEDEQRRYSLRACFNLSLKRLNAEQLRKFAWLGVLPEDVDLSGAVAEVLWDVRSIQAKKGLIDLRNRSFLMSGIQTSEGEQTYRVHNLMHVMAMVLIENGELGAENWEIAHSQFLERYRGRSVDGSWYGLKNDGYIHRHLTWHLEMAGRLDEIYALMTVSDKHGQNLWSKTCNRIGKPSIFVQDFALAWQKASDIRGGELIESLMRVVPEVLDAIQSIQIDRLKANALSGIPSCLSEVLPEVFKNTCSIEDRTSRLQALMRLVPFLWLTDTDVRLREANELSNIGTDTAAIPSLLKLLENSDPLVRGSTAEVLGNIGSEMAIPGLFKLLEDTHAYVREMTVWALGEIGSETVIPGLIGLIQDIDSTVDRNVIEALGKLGTFALERAIEVAQSINDREKRLEVLTGVAEEIRRVGGDRTEELLGLIDNLQLSSINQVVNSPTGSATSLSQLEREINRLFVDAIDMADFGNQDDNLKNHVFNARAIAAYSLHILAGVEVDTAANAIVDGYNDNAIDALLFHRDQNMLWVVHAKWNNRQSPPDLGALLKFKQGILDLLMFDRRFDRFSAKFSLKREEIESALRSPGLKIKIVVAHTGTEISKHGRNILEDLLEELNDKDSDLASLEIFDLLKAYNSLIDRHGNQSDNLNHLQSTAVYDIAISSTASMISVGEEVKITINLSDTAADNDGGAYLLKIPSDEVVGSELNILLNTSGLRLEGDSVASLSLDLNHAQSTARSTEQTAHFRLTALRPGITTINAEIYRGDTFETNLETTIQVIGLEGLSFLDNIKIVPRPVPQPDLILQIQTVWNESLSSCNFRYHLDSFHPRLPFAREMQQQSNTLTSGWMEQMRSLLQVTLEDAASSLPGDFRSRLTSLGQSLFQQLLPLELQTTFRSVMRSNQSFTLLILADRDAELPWELLHDGQNFWGDRFIMGRWSWELDQTRSYEFAIGSVNLTHYADVEQPEQWAALLEPTGAPPPMPLSGGVLGDLGMVDAMRGLYLLRQGQSIDEVERQNAPVRFDALGAETLEQELQPAKLSLRRNRPLVTLGYVSAGLPELTTLEQTWAPTFIRGGCSAFVGPLWAVSPAVEAAFVSSFYHRLWAGDSLGLAFQVGRRAARSLVPDSLDWMAYTLFGDPMARPYRPSPGQGYAIVEPIGQEITDPIAPGASVRFRVSLRRSPPVWYGNRLMDVAEDLTFSDLQVYITASGLPVALADSIGMQQTLSGDYFGWFTLTVPATFGGDTVLVQVHFEDDGDPIHSLRFALTVSGQAEDQS